MRKLSWLACVLLVLSASASGMPAQSTRRVSEEPGGVQSYGVSGQVFGIPRPSPVSADGRFVVFITQRVLLSLRDMATGSLTFVAPGDWPAISGDGQVVAFASWHSLVPEDTNNEWDIYVRDYSANTTERISVDSNDQQGTGRCGGPSVSWDGRFVAFFSADSTLVPGDNNGWYDIFVRDRQAGTTTLVSAGVNGLPSDRDSVWPSISYDGRYVAFDSYASNLVPGDSNASRDIFLWDRVTGATNIVSVSSSGELGNDHSTNPSLSGDGHFVAFYSSATNLVPGGGSANVFVRNLVAGATTAITSEHAIFPALSADGRFVAFESSSPSIVLGDSNGSSDVFLHDRATGTTSRVSISSAGSEAFPSGWFGSRQPSISGDGRVVTFVSSATNLVAGDTNDATDVFARDTGPSCPPPITYYRDNDGDGYGDSSNTTQSCSAPAGFVLDHADCDDLNPLIHPNATEVCNQIDDDCDGLVDEGFSMNYCTAKVNSQGCLPSIGSEGSPSLSGTDNFFITATLVRNNQWGIMLWGGAPDAAPFHGGTLCLHSPLIRTPAQASEGTPGPLRDCSGHYSFPFSQAYMFAHFINAGDVLFAQYYYRDPPHPDGTGVGLTDGLRFTICP